MFIVSRNYRDRESPYKWLIRLASESIEKAKAFKRVVAKRVKFVTSNDGESGFGCKLVAQCELATGSDPEVVMRELQFTGYEFKFGDSEYVGAVEDLVLNEDGSMSASTVE